MDYETILVDTKDQVTTITFNRPERRNAMNPRMHTEMVDVLTLLENDDECRVLVLTGAGESFCAGQDLKEYFYDIDQDQVARAKARKAAETWRSHLLRLFPKPTIAAVNGYCFGGAFTQLFSCDFAIAAEDAIFGLSEVNWGIIPGGIVTKVVADALAYRDALYYIMTGETFDGTKAAQIGLVNEAVPREHLRERTAQLARTLMEKNPAALKAAKHAYRRVLDMSWDDAEDYLFAKIDQSRFLDPEKGRDKGMSQFLDEKTYKPGLGAYKRDR